MQQYQFVVSRLNEVRSFIESIARGIGLSGAGVGYFTYAVGILALALAGTLAVFLVLMAGSLVGKAIGRLCMKLGDTPAQADRIERILYRSFFLLVALAAAVYGYLTFR
jgi:hypothetical protein